MTKYRLHLGDCLDVMKYIPDNSFHSVVTDPPYGLKFMGKNWDHGIPGEIFWKEILRVSKPGAHLLAFGGTRTHHRLMVAIEDAGWEIRDCLMWLYGSGFPKSHNISKAIDKQAENSHLNGTFSVIVPATDAAKKWDGWGTALKPAYEPIILARKPLSEKTVAENVLKWRVGVLNIDACRIEASNRPLIVLDAKSEANGAVYAGPREAGHGFDGGSKDIGTTNLGRWPANLILECICEEVIIEEDDKEPYSYSGREYNNKKTSMFNGDKPQSPSNYNDADKIIRHTNPECPCYMIDQQSGDRKAGGKVKGTEESRTGQNGIYSTWGRVENSPFNDSGGASRFFYCSKASKRDRGEGNDHPTVKSIDLMRYLCRLITPSNGIILDPFMGSVSTGKAALLENFRFYGIEKEKNYFEIAEKRISEVIS